MLVLTILQYQRHTIPNQNLIYLDANNLYGVQCRSFYQHTDSVSSPIDDEIAALELEDLCDDSEDGYIYEVDLHYPTELHNTHANYPLAPESLLIDRAIYSPTQSEGQNQVRCTLS